MQTIQENISTNRRASKAASKLVSSNRTKRIGTRNKQIIPNPNSNNGVSNLRIYPTVNELFLNELSQNDLRLVAECLTNAVAHYTPKVWSWDFNPQEETIHTLINKCLNWFEDNFEVEYFEVFKIEKDIEIRLLTRAMETGKIHVIEIDKVYRLKNKNNKIYNILLSFIKSLPFENALDYGYCGMAEMVFDYNIEREKEEKEEALNNNNEYEKCESTHWIKKRQAWFNKIEQGNWENDLLEYNPKKEKYIRIKELLLTANTINFNVPFQVANKYDADFSLDFSSLYLVTDYEDSAYTDAYLENINCYAQEMSTTAPYILAIANKQDFTPFDFKKTKQISQLNEFVKNFNKILSE